VAAAQRGRRLASVDPDILAPAGAQLPEVGDGQPGRGQGSGGGLGDPERSRQDRIGAAGDLDGVGAIRWPARDRQQGAQPVGVAVVVMAGTPSSPSTLS
jgi:hypothetical protein